MEENRMLNEQRVGIGTVLEPGSYSIEGEEMLLRVRLKGTPLLCLIDAERRVREILSVQMAGKDVAAPAGEVAFDASRLPVSGDCLESEDEPKKYAEAAGQVTERFAAIVQRFAGESRACLKKLAEVLDPGNSRLSCAYRDGGAPALKAYLIRELFKRTVREERGFKVLLLLSQVIALDGNSQPERLEAMTLEQQKQLLREFMDFLKVAGHMRIDPRIFEEIYEKFNDLEYANLSRGGTGFFIKPLYIQEMQEMKAQVLNDRNANYIEQLYRNSLREPLDFLYENTLAYLKALAIVRLYANSNRRQRGGDSRIVEHLLGDLLRFRPARVGSAAKAPALSA